MLDVIEKLISLQDCDRNILQIAEELERIPPEQESLKSKLDTAQKSLDAAKHQVKHLESERKKLELDAEQKKELIAKYSLQQYQTKKNEEYRALNHEIATCKKNISKIEDQELELMEQGEAAQKQVGAANQEVAVAKRTVDSRVNDLETRKKELQEKLSQLQANREKLAADVDSSALNRYERTLTNKGSTVLVGIHRGVCGGCHMQLSRQTVVHCQANQEIVNCTNCGRILYFTPDMDVGVPE